MYIVAILGLTDNSSISFYSFAGPRVPIQCSMFSRYNKNKYSALKIIESMYRCRQYCCIDQTWNIIITMITHLIAWKSEFSFSLFLGDDLGPGPDLILELKHINCSYASIVILNFAIFQTQTTFIFRGTILLLLSRPLIHHTINSTHTIVKCPQYTILNRYSTKIQLVKNLFHVLIAFFTRLFHTGDKMSMSHKLIFSPFVLDLFSILFH